VRPTCYYFPVTAPADILSLIDPADEGSRFELFLRALLDHDDEWGGFDRATDGVDDYRVFERSTTRARLCGRLYEVSAQTRHAFWLDIERDHNSARELRWTFYFDALVASPRQARNLVDLITAPEDVEWRTSLSGRAVIQDEGLRVQGHGPPRTNRARRANRAAGGAAIAAAEQELEQGQGVLADELWARLRALP
jgi:hypothetical protein